MKGREARSRGGGDHRAAAQEVTYRADKIVSYVTNGVNLELDGGGVAVDEVAGNAKDEFVIPGRIFSTDSIEIAAELGIGIHPSDRVGVHTTTPHHSRFRNFQILRRDQVDLKNPRLLRYIQCLSLHLDLDLYLQIKAL